MFPAHVLSSLKNVLGSDGYAGQHQQRPTAAEGGMFKREWWRFYRMPGALHAPESRPVGCTKILAEDLPARFDQVVGSLDAAFKGTESSDPVALGVWGQRGARKYLLALWHGQMTFTQTLERIREAKARFPQMSTLLVEDKANGSAIIDTLRGEISGIIAVNPEGGKAARAFSIQPQVEAGNVIIPEGCSWVAKFVDEHASFPRGRHDDIVDMTSQALLRMASSETGFARRFAAAVRAGRVL
jgi:predicted phage terminase large subunit-like protein